MDLFVALAAAGAGYVVRHCENTKRKEHGKNLSEVIARDPKLVKPDSPTFMGHLVDKNYPLQRLARLKRLNEDTSNQIGSKEEVGCTCGLENHIVHPAASMPCGYLKNEHTQIIAEESGQKDGLGENMENPYIEPPRTEISCQYDFKKNRSSLRSRRFNLQTIKPLTSIESCLMAQLYNEYAGAEEYVLSHFPSPSSPSVRPIVVTDGKRIISREADSLNLQHGTGRNGLLEQMNLAENEIGCGVTSLPYNMSLEAPRRKVTKGKGLVGKLNSSGDKRKHSDSPAGLSNGALLFGLGISVGLVSSLLANRREVAKLNGLLKRTENLVQDLQEELEMRDLLTVKELAIEDFESQNIDCESYNKKVACSSSSEQNLDGSKKCNGRTVPDQRGERISGSMSRIEAELEAELERLELNMNSSSLERRMSDLIEFDPNFEPGISQGDLRPDMFDKRAGKQPYADQDGSGSSTPHPVNYPVSPRELSLRLHEIIQNRLEERVKELETALEVSERKVQAMESGHKVVMRDQSEGEPRSSPVGIDEREKMDQPVVINLCGEALDAYNEAYDELMKVNENEDNDLRGGGGEDNQRLPLADKNGQQDLYHNNENFANDNDNALSRAVSTLDWQISSGDVGYSRTESESDDEFEKLLIKQIVEKTRRDSSVILNVKRELFEDKI